MCPRVLRILQISFNINSVLMRFLFMIQDIILILAFVYFHNHYIHLFLCEILWQLSGMSNITFDRSEYEEFSTYWTYLIMCQNLH